MSKYHIHNGLVFLRHTVVPNTLNFCGNFLSIVNIEALLLLNGSRQA